MSFKKRLTNVLELTDAVDVHMKKIPLKERLFTSQRNL